MGLHLPLVSVHEKEHTYCAFCPKLCRHSCPVSTVQARETTTPWGKMTSVHHVAHGNLPRSAEYAAPWYACTGCMRCRTFCDHGNDVAATLYAARTDAVRLEIAPSAAATAIASHRAREERARSAAAGIFGAAMRRRLGRTVYFPGCTSLTRRPSVATADFKIIERATGERPSIEANSCCGLPLLEAGDREGFLASAKRLLERFRAAGRIIVGDPGCLHAIKVRARELGLEPDVEMLHLTEVAVERVSDFRSIKVKSKVRYHDACRLGRGLGVYDAPRTLLKQILGESPEEYSQRRERSECTGAGGVLPRTDPETASNIARERITEHEAAGGGMLVTACSGAARWLERHAESSPVRHLSELLAEAIHE